MEIVARTALTISIPIYTLENGSTISIPRHTDETQLQECKCLRRIGLKVSILDRHTNEDMDHVSS